MPRPASASSLSPSRLWTAFAVLVGLVAALHALCLFFNTKDQIDPYNISDYWPLSVFTWRKAGFSDWGWAGAAAAFYLLLRQRLKPGFSFLLILGGAFGLTVLANASQGLVWGLDYPTAGWGEGGIEYLHDARAIQGPLWFLRRFHDLQPVLLVHAVTHPPGPILLYWALDQLFRHPIAISLAVCLLALALNLSAWRRLLDLAGIPPRLKAQLGLLFAVLPGVSIYYLAVMDAVFAGVLSWALVGFIDEERRSGIWACSLALLAASLLSFGYLFIFPVLAGLVWLRRRGLGRLALVGAVMVAGWLLLYALFGFNYLRAFLVASKLENEGGFLLLANPRQYVWYRLGAVLEIALYFTPFLLLQLPGGLRLAAKKAPLARQLFWLGTASVAAMLLSGAMKIGEAARICLFLLPYLLLPVAVRWMDKDADEVKRARLVDLVFAMGLGMQLMGNYQW